MKKFILMSAVAFSFTMPAFADSKALSVAPEAVSPERMQKKRMVLKDDDRQGGEHKGAGMFKKKDLDGNGFISKEEFSKAHEARFNKMDKDGDGSISKEEAKAAHKAHKGHKDERLGKVKDARKDMQVKKTDALNRASKNKAAKE